MKFEIKNDKLITKILSVIKMSGEKIHIEEDDKYFYVFGEAYMKISKKEVGILLGDTSAKRIIITRRDILADTFESQPNKMGAGKLAAQVGHAIEGLNLKLLRNGVDYKNYKAPENNYELKTTIIKNTAKAEYFEGNFSKIILCTKSGTKLINFHKMLEANNITNVLVEDSGFTVFDGKPTYTCIGIEPMYSYIIDCFTSKLQLLK